MLCWKSDQFLKNTWTILPPVAEMLLCHWRELVAVGIFETTIAAWGLVSIVPYSTTSIVQLHCERLYLPSPIVDASKDRCNRIKNFKNVQRDDSWCRWPRPERRRDHRPHEDLGRRDGGERRVRKEKDQRYCWLHWWGLLKGPEPMSQALAVAVVVAQVVERWTWVLKDPGSKRATLFSSSLIKSLDKFKRTNYELWLSDIIIISG